MRAPDGTGYAEYGLRTEASTRDPSDFCHFGSRSDLAQRAGVEEISVALRNYTTFDDDGQPCVYFILFYFFANVRFHNKQ